MVVAKISYQRLENNTGRRVLSLLVVSVLFLLVMQLASATPICWNGTVGATHLWTFDDADTGGGVSSDACGAKDGTIGAGVTTGVQGISNEAYLFNGQGNFSTTTSYVVNTNPIQNTGNTDFSWCYWIKPRILPPSGAGGHSPASNNGWGIVFSSLLSTGNISGGIRDTGTNALLLTSTANLSTDVWSSVCWVYNSTPHTIMLYLNGTQDSNLTNVAVVGNLYDAGSRYVVGAGWVGSVSEYRKGFNGTLDDIAYYGYTMTSAEVMRDWGGVMVSSPVDGYHNNTFTTTYSLLGITPDNCSLWANDTFSGLNTTDLTSTSNTITNNTLQGQGFYNWYIGCQDAGGGWTNSSTRTFTLDTFAPQITVDSPDLSDVYFVNHNILLNATYTDNIDLFDCAYDIYFPNGTLQDSNSIACSGTSFTWDNETWNAPVTGVYNVNFSAMDSHTSAAWTPRKWWKNDKHLYIADDVQQDSSNSNSKTGSQVMSAPPGPVIPTQPTYSVEWIGWQNEPINCANGKTLICKVTPNHQKDICVSDNAVPAQIATGSYYGPCTETENVDVVLEAEKLNDRIEFSYNITGSMSSWYLLRVQATHSLEYIENSNYTGHFVLNGNNWMDFQDLIDNDFQFRVDEVGDNYAVVAFNPPGDGDGQVLADPATGGNNFNSTSLNVTINGFQVNVYDENTYANITNWTMTVQNSTYSRTFTHQNNTFTWDNFSDFPTGTLSISITADGYVTRYYYETFALNDPVALDAYLLDVSEGIYTYFIVQNTYGNLINNALITFQFLNASVWITSGEVLTDSTGSASMWLDFTQVYRITTTKDGYAPVVKTITPQPTTYLITLGGGGLLNYEDINGSLWTVLSPTQTTLNTTTDSISMSVFDPDTNISICGLNLTYQNGTVFFTQNSTTEPSVCSITTNLSSFGLGSEKIWAVPWFNATSTNFYEWSRLYTLNDRGGKLGNAFEEMGGYLGTEAKLMLAIFLTLLMGGATAFYLRSGASLVMMAVSGIFMYYGWFGNYGALWIIAVMAGLAALYLERRQY